MDYTENALTFDWLRERSQSRFFDRVTMVTDRIDEVVKNLRERYAMDGWTVEETEVSTAANGRGEPLSYKQRSAVAKLGNVELCVVEPVEGVTPCAAYFARYGEGLCCVRENLSEENFEKELARYAALGISVLMTEKDAEGETVWLNMMNLWGGLFAIHKDTPTSAATRFKMANDRKLTQINITTDDADRTAAQVSTVLEMGPWSIGTLNNQTVTNGRLLVDGEYVSPAFSFQLAITFYANIEFEIIQPVLGPTVYLTYIDKHGVGYHHIKEVVPPSQLENVMRNYENDGFKLAITGSVGPTTFTYLECEKQFGFYVELGDGIPADPLPEGYNEYSYPKQ